MPKFALEHIDETAVIAYFRGESEKDELSTKLREQVTRLERAHTLMGEHGSRRTVAKMLMKEFGYGLTTGYADINLAQEYLSTVTKNKKEYYRILITDVLMERFLAAKEAKDDLAVARLARELSRALGLDQEDGNVPDWSKVQPPRPRFGFYPNQTGVHLDADFKEQILETLKGIKGIRPEDFLNDIPEAEIV